MAMLGSEQAALHFPDSAEVSESTWHFELRSLSRDEHGLSLFPTPTEQNALRFHAETEARRAEAEAHRVAEQALRLEIEARRAAEQRIVELEAELKRRSK